MDWLDLYVDRELDVPQAIEFERHLESCPECKLAFEQIRGVQGAVQRQATYFTVPDGLADRIMASLPSDVESAGERESARLRSGRGWWSWLGAGLAIAPEVAWKWLGIGATAAFALMLAVNVQLYRSSSSANQQLEQALVDDHVRSMMTGHLMDVPSTDQHTVKPWFNGKLDFSPPVIELKDQGFPLIGGRLDYIAGHPAAVIVYRRNRHPIDLYVWPTTQDQSRPTHMVGEHGYHVVHWQSAGMTFWAVSDLNQVELTQFAYLLQQKLSSADTTSNL